MFDEEEKRNCWEIEPRLTKCAKIFLAGSVSLKNKMVFCKNCLYFQLANENTLVEPNIKFHSFQ